MAVTAWDQRIARQLHGGRDEGALRKHLHLARRVARALVDTVADRGFRQALLDVYTPRYGSEWEAFLDGGATYARIAADRMFTFHMEKAPG